MCLVPGALGLVLGGAEEAAAGHRRAQAALYLNEILSIHRYIFLNPFPSHIYSFYLVI